MMRVADVLAQRLYQAGCRRAYGIPGGEVLTLIDALERAGIRFILTRHENSAGFMAEGDYHATGAPALLVATLGPGVANAVNVIANAEQDRVPLIVLSGCVEASMAVRYTHQVFDHQAVLRPLVKGSLRLCAGAEATLADRAVVLALDGRPGPVHLDIPLELAATAAQELPQAPWCPPAPLAPAPGDALNHAHHLLRHMRRPLVLAGLELLHQPAAVQTLNAFVQQYRLPVLTTYKAKGVLDERHALALGGAGLSPRADALLKPLLTDCDGLLLLGYDPIEMRSGWIDPWPATTPVIEIGAAQLYHGMHAHTVHFAGDIDATLQALSPALDDGLLPDPHWLARIESTRLALRQSLDCAISDWGPVAIIDEAQRLLPAGAVLTVDSGAHRIVLSQRWQAPAPRRLLQSTGLCTMGCALPLAMGYRLATDHPAPTVAMIGDGCLEMVLGELATLRDLQLPLILIVFVDRALALIELKQRRSGLAKCGVDSGGTDFAAVARAFGGQGIDIHDRSAFVTALEQALQRSDGFSLLACHLPAPAYDDLI